MTPTALSCRQRISPSVSTAWSAQMPPALAHARGGEGLSVLALLIVGLLATAAWSQFPATTTTTATKATTTTAAATDESSATPDPCTAQKDPAWADWLDTGFALGPEPWQDPNQWIDPNVAVMSLRAGDPIATREQHAMISNLHHRNGAYWLPIYHQQVTAELFALIRYPYYRGGTEYDIADWDAWLPIRYTHLAGSDATRPATGSGQATTDPTETDSPSQPHRPSPSAKPATQRPHTNNPQDKPIPSSAESQPSTPPTPSGSSTPSPVSRQLPHAIGEIPSPLKQSATTMIRWCEMIHRWRQLNESAWFMLEVARAVELTRMDTGIYHTRPAMAVEVRRTLGQLAHTNDLFDQLSRVTLLHVLQHGDSLETYALIGRMDKLLTQAGTLAEALAKANDAISDLLGMGPFDRRHPMRYYGDTMDYAELNPLWREFRKPR